MSSSTHALNLLKQRVSSIEYQRVLSTNYEKQERRNTIDTWKKVKRTDFKENISTYEQITVNTPTFKNAIIFDVDNPELFETPDVAPTWQTYNKSNDKHHVGYLLKDEIYTKTQKQKDWYNTVIKPSIVKVSWLINADGNYKNTTTKNPFNDRRYNTKTSNNILSSVWDLLEPYNNDISYLSNMESSQKNDGKYLSENYKSIMAELIEQSQMNTTLLFSDKKEYINVMNIKASIMKDKEEAAAIVKDVISFSMEWAKEVSERQSKRSKERWGNTVEKNKLNITNAIIDILARGFKPTIKNISMCINLAEETLKRKQYSQFIKSEKARLKPLI